jgi:hypothetical protein
MKVVFNNSNPKHKKDAMLLPLVPFEQITLTKENSIGLTKMQMHILRGGKDIRTIITWYNLTEHVFNGLNLHENINRHSMLETFLQDTAWMLYAGECNNIADGCHLVASRNAAAAQRNVVLAEPLDNHHEVEDIMEAIRFMMSKIMPHPALAHAKCFFRHECCKPHDMKVQEYLQRLLRINRTELIAMSPHAENQSLSDDELLDILLFGTPCSWQHKMEHQGFDPMENDINDVVNFMEQIESSEDFDANAS